MKHFARCYVIITYPSGKIFEAYTKVPIKMNGVEVSPHSLESILLTLEHVTKENNRKHGKKYHLDCVEFHFYTIEEKKLILKKL